jgi:hypothetical protein
MPTIGDPAIDFSGSDIVNGGTFALSDHYGEVIWIALVSPG